MYFLFIQQFIFYSGGQAAGDSSEWQDICSFANNSFTFAAALSRIEC